MNPLLPALVAVAILFGLAIVCAMSWSWMETRRCEERDRAREERDRARQEAEVQTAAYQNAVKGWQDETRRANAAEERWRYWERSCYGREEQLRKAAEMVRDRVVVDQAASYERIAFEINQMSFSPREGDKR